ncbi:MAG: amidophosphoribosyltransferase [Bacteroidales bacterium]|nr:amidophosphoribosyltransferase [Bacteroidales bacterium]MDY2859801.1 amidophosphoribosyltransferase [Candidatus Cryptobacteroides sp.]MDY5443037.1 amidophosphoribosyltransferase [Candidatus Cryptobacteroides sp.]MDY5570369.1 amidophosphoribosyltransferase [Candidatus Cryptobacteroides sp.]
MGGLFGTITREGECARDLFYGTDYHSHLGTRRAGMATFSMAEGFFRSIHSLESSYFRTKFEAELPKFKGSSGIGVISDTDAQPLLMKSHLGRFAVATVAKVNNLDEISASLLDKNMPLSEFSSGRINQTELISLLIIQGNDIVSGIENVFRTVKGSCSLLLLTEDGIIAARDSWGRTPLIIGKKDGAYAVAGETTSFANLDYEIEHYIGPGEIVRIKADGYEVLRKPNKGMQVCSFLWIYYGFPTSFYEGRNVEDMRNEAGRIMGEEDDTEVDYASGIPDSGIGMAIGYAEGHKVPYKRGICKYTPTWPRSFMPVNQETRNLVAKMKLIPNSAILKDKRVLFCDDSIVRGTQLRDSTKLLHELGAKEVHMRIACPPLIHACPFVNFSASKSELELITRRVIRDFEGENPQNIDAYSTTGSPEYNRMVSEIARELNLDSLKFSKIESIVSAIGLPKCRICTHCFDGSSFHTLKEENK